MRSTHGTNGNGVEKNMRNIAAATATVTDKQLLKVFCCERMVRVCGAPLCRLSALFIHVNMFVRNNNNNKNGSKLQVNRYFTRIMWHLPTKSISLSYDRLRLRQRENETNESASWMRGSTEATALVKMSFNWYLNAVYL